MATITFSCPACGHVMTLPEELVGKKGKCPSCQTENKVVDIYEHTEDIRIAKYI